MDEVFNIGDRIYISNPELTGSKSIKRGDRGSVRHVVVGGEVDGYCLIHFEDTGDERYVPPRSIRKR